MRAVSPTALASKQAPASSAPVLPAPRRGAAPRRAARARGRERDCGEEHVRRVRQDSEPVRHPSVANERAEGAPRRWLPDRVRRYRTATVAPTPGPPSATRAGGGRPVSRRRSSEVLTGDDGLRDRRRPTRKRGQAGSERRGAWACWATRQSSRGSSVPDDPKALEREERVDALDRPA